MPTSKGDIKRQYVAACRRRFRLTSVDGVSDADFYREKGARRDPPQD
ncbi:MAG TPA: hypothetical protein VHY91_14100 [Pirellulales bacterium]|nr:hypothetical protein [Pirellulales bacterium]